MAIHARTLQSLEIGKSLVVPARDFVVIRDGLFLFSIQKENGSYMCNLTADAVLDKIKYGYTHDTAKHSRQLNSLLCS